MLQRIDYIVDWLKRHNKTAKTNGFILGLSGGIDSALVAALCKKACPQTSGIIMPCHSNPQDALDAQKVAEALGLHVTLVDLSTTFDTLLAAFPKEGEPTRMAIANLKPRLRMTTLYYYANLYNRLVVGTGNRDERYVGYFTKWGDGAADIMPIAHLSKGEVWQMAAELGVPEQIINKPPSAGLWENQTDEQEMGFTYSALNSYLSGEYVHADIKKRIEHLHNVSRHKLSLPPIINEEK